MCKLSVQSACSGHTHVFLHPQSLGGVASPPNAAVSDIPARDQDAPMSEPCEGLPVTKEAEERNSDDMYDKEDLYQIMYMSVLYDILALVLRREHVLSSSRKPSTNRLRLEGINTACQWDARPSPESGALSRFARLLIS